MIWFPTNWEKSELALKSSEGALTIYLLYQWAKYWMKCAIIYALENNGILWNPKQDYKFAEMLL